GGRPSAGGGTCPPITTTPVSARAPGRHASNAARFVYGPTATTVAPASTLAASSSRARPEGSGRGAIGSGQYAGNVSGTKNPPSDPSAPAATGMSIRPARPST